MMPFVVKSRSIIKKKRSRSRKKRRSHCIRWSILIDSDEISDPGSKSGVIFEEGNVFTSLVFNDSSYEIVDVRMPLMMASTDYLVVITKNGKPL